MTTIEKKVIVWDSLIILILIFFDLITKYLFFNHGIGSSLSLIEPAMNNGISFSLTVSSSIVFPITMISLLFFSYMYSKKMFPRWSLIFLFAGTIGNFYDRIIYDGVRDFLVFPYWFIFNLADIFLFIGIVWACLYMLWEDSQKHKKVQV